MAPPLAVFSGLKKIQNIKKKYQRKQLQKVLTHLKVLIKERTNYFLQMGKKNCVTLR